MVALTLSGQDSMPTGLTAKPPGGADELKAAVLLAPWCADDILGYNMIASVHADFVAQVPLLAILPGADNISDVALCREILERNMANGATVQIELFPGAGHTFAQALDDYGKPFADYDAAFAADAEARIYEFLAERLQ
jgi:dienelactone hydrolase